MTNIKLFLHNMKIVFSKRKMKHFIVCSIVIVLGECSNWPIESVNAQLAIASYQMCSFLFAVFCLYKSFISLEIIEGIDPNRFSVLTDKNRGNVAAHIEVSNQEELTSSYDELSEAKKRLKLLEMKIQTLENRISKKYPDVLFLNYKNRKRILVSQFFCRDVLDRLTS